MKPKTLKISYWTVTGIFAAVAALTGIPTEGGKEVMALLGYPAYLLQILLVAKVLGAIALVQPKFHIIKEWAYAGFTIDFIGAAVSGIIATDDAAFVVMPSIFLAVMAVSYYLWKRMRALPSTPE